MIITKPNTSRNRTGAPLPVMRGFLLALLGVIMMLPTVGRAEFISNIDNFHWTDREGRKRFAQFYVPSKAKQAFAAGADIPLVMVLHGGNGRPGRARHVTGMDDFAEKYGFLVAYPSAWSNPDYPRKDKKGRWLKARNRHWNDGRNDPTIPNQRDGIDDLPFIRALIDEAEAQYGADRKRIYAMGLSNGGFLSIRIACTDGGLFRAIAPVISLVPKSVADDCVRAGPVSMVMIAGTADPVIDFHARERRKRPVYWLSGRASIDLWRRKNGCPARASRQQELPDRLISDGSSAVMEDWQNCRSGATLRFYRVIGGGHTLPGREPFSRPHLGTSNLDFDATAHIVRFFGLHGWEAGN